MFAVVLAAGEGSRLRPLTSDRPKPMVPLGGRPALEYVFGWLHHYGIRDIAVNLHYRADAIRDHFGDGSRFGLNLYYGYEPELLGTAGGVAQFRHLLTETFLVCYGDVLTDLDLGNLLDVHRRRRSEATIGLYQVPDPWTRGVVDIDVDLRITGFREKPPRDACAPDSLVNTGDYVLEPSVLDLIPPGQFSDFGHDVFPALLRAGRPMIGWNTGAYVVDYGTIEQYHQADADVRDGVLRTWPIEANR